MSKNKISRWEKIHFNSEVVDDFRLRQKLEKAYQDGTIEFTGVTYEPPKKGMYEEVTPTTWKKSDNGIMTSNEPINKSLFKGVSGAGKVARVERMVQDDGYIDHKIVSDKELEAELEKAYQDGTLEFTSATYEPPKNSMYEEVTPTTWKKNETGLLVSKLSNDQIKELLNRLSSSQNNERLDDLHTLRDVVQNIDANKQSNSSGRHK